MLFLTFICLPMTSTCIYIIFCPLYSNPWPDAAGTAVKYRVNLGNRAFQSATWKQTPILTQKQWQHSRDLSKAKNTYRLICWRWLVKTEWVDLYWVFGFDRIWVWNLIKKHMNMAFFGILIGKTFRVHGFLFIRTNNFRLRMGCSQFFGDFSLKLLLNCSYFLTFPNSGLVAQNNKKALRNMCLLLFHPVVCKKTWNCHYSVRERRAIAYHSSSAQRLSQF